MANFDYGLVCSPEQAVFAESHVLEPYPDISGLGVVIAFIATGFIACILLVAHYLFVHDPQKCPFNEKSGVDRARWKPNPVDVHCIEGLRLLIMIPNPGVPLWDAFDDCILNMCDIQIATGFAILISGFILLRNNPDSPLSAYHWYMVSLLAWFSAVTHLAGLTVLRSYFYNHPWVKAIRVTLMGLLLVLVIVSLIPTAYFSWTDYDSVDIPVTETTFPFLSSPAVCFFNYDTARRLINAWINGSLDASTDGIVDREEVWNLYTPPFEAMVMGILILALGFISRLIKLNAHLSRFASRSCRRPISTFLRSSICLVAVLPFCGKSSRRPRSGWMKLYMDTIVCPLFCIYLALRIATDVLASTTFEIVSVVFAVVWGTQKLAAVRSNVIAGEKFIHDENLWTYGQIMAVILLASPLLTLAWKFSSDINQLKTASCHETVSSSGQGTSPAPSGGPGHAPPAENSSDVTFSFDDIQSGAEVTDTLQALFRRDVYQTSSWIWPPLAWSCIFIIGLLVCVSLMTNLTSNMRIIFTMSEFWLNRNVFIFYVLYACPAALVAGLVPGVLLDDCFRDHSRAKLIGLAVWSLIVNVVYFMLFYVGPEMMYVSRTEWPSFIVGLTFAVSTAVYLLFLALYAIIAIRNRTHSHVGLRQSKQSA